MTYKPRPVDLIFPVAARRKELNRCVNMDGKCPNWNKTLTDADFRDDISRKEWKISGMCQACQDNFFGADDEQD